MVVDVWPALADLVGLVAGVVALGVASWNAGRATGYRQGVRDAVGIQGKGSDGER